MIEKLFGSVFKERILLFITARGEGYANEMADYYNTSLSPFQKQLDNLEAASVLISKKAGRTRLYQFNPRYPFLDELKSLLEKALQFLPDDEKERLINIRKRPRRRGKPL